MARLAMLIIPAIPFSFPGLPGVRCLFSTRDAGDMASDGVDGMANRRRFMAGAGFGKWAETRQEHGDLMVEAHGTGEPFSARPETADGLYTFEKGVGLVIRTADCQPVFFAREDGGAVAAIHVGWRGNAMNFPGTAVKRLCGLFSCRPEALLAVRGPSLGPAAAEFVNFRREWPAEFAAWFDEETKTFNLWRLTRRQLAEAGMRGERIFSLDMCTRDMSERFFSHRRGEKGRMANVIWRI